MKFYFRVLSNKIVIFSYETGPINWMFNQYWGYVGRLFNPFTGIIRYIFFSQRNIVHRDMPQDWDKEMTIGEFLQDRLGWDLDAVLITYGVSHKYSPGPLSLTWFNLNPTMGKWLHLSWNRGWNYLCISKLSRWNFFIQLLRMDK